MNVDPIQFSPEEFYEGIIVGGGTCGLAVAARLCEPRPDSIFTEDEHQRFHWLRQRKSKTNILRNKPSYVSSSNFHPGELLVIDQTGNKFMQQWDNQFASCQIPHLRSPMFFHVDPLDIDGMVAFAHLNKRQDELMEITNVVGKEFSKHQQKRLKSKLHRKSDGVVDINMRNWKDYYRPSTRLFSDYCAEVVARYKLQDCVIRDSVVDVQYRLIQCGGEDIGMGFVVRTQSGKVFGCKFVVVASGHVGKVNFPLAPFANEAHFPHGACHTTHLFHQQVQFLDPKYFRDPQRKRIVIVGGGLTSAQLAHVACRDPTVSSITLLFRSAVKIKHFDFHLDWVSKYKNFKKSIYHNQETDALRYEMMIEARGGGSINPEYLKKLNKHVKDHRLTWLQKARIASQAWNGHAWDLTIEQQQEREGGGEDEAVELRNVDYIYFATGSQADVKSLPFLRHMHQEHPIEVTCGYPALTDNLQWNNDVPLFMVGRNAALKIGPTSANLDGARLGAERVGWYVQNMKLDGKFDWSPVKVEPVKSTSSAFETRLQLASGQLNWFELLNNT
ncbi:uncharacterized protein LODBEIA_P13340 [Lodderomyces beijingensis]|uniref:L-ornithine N(5)-monooxygenase [NAD(P)H] n=1 Tax=Lodderomyces beijingensis TaxID=1775926 RepID=A0ABP0ZLF2_9ASCO